MNNLQQLTLEDVRFDDQGLVTAVVQDARSREVLMVAWMSAESLRLTLETGETHFWSRSRQTMWHKGETSGNIQRVRSMRVDCDADTLLLWSIRLAQPATPGTGPASSEK